VPVIIGSNTSSTLAQEGLGKSTAAVVRSSERLSSGLRINAASDDAAGLAIAADLNASSRVYTMGIRNLNDGVSALNIADQALEGLSLLTIRQKELAEETANGVYSAKQRTALNVEANALVDEFNRIISTTAFNGQNLLDGTFRNVTLQAGFGASGSINVGIGDKLGRAVGTGTFSTGAGVNGQNNPTGLIAIDVNHDDKLDIVSLQYFGGNVSIALGNGDGTFGAVQSFASGGGGSASIVAGDFNGDGNPDLAVSGGTNANVLLGNGDGTFRAATSLSTSASTLNVTDVNGDGVTDIVSADASSVDVFFGNGDGTFRTAISTATVANSYASATVADFNRDGVPDVAFTNGNAPAKLYLGNRDGTFSSAPDPSSTASGPMATADLNGDGIADLVYGSNNFLAVQLGNGDGTFRGVSTLGTGVFYTGLSLDDITGDGKADIVANRSDGTLAFFAGNGDGTFSTGATRPSTASQLVTGDFNGDGVPDVASPISNSTVQIYNADTTKVSTIIYLDLTTQSGARAALTTTGKTLDRVDQERANIGSSLSRITVASNNLLTSRENFDAASSRITDVDVASESAELTRNRILQNVGAAILAEANLLPELALTLLKAT
jgi:flagellin-like hook-associated protein FlgL